LDGRGWFHQFDILGLHKPSKDITMTDTKKPTASKKPTAVAKAKRVAQMAEARDRKQLAMKGKLTAAHQQLAPIAKEINVRMEKAGQALDKADDHRLAAALRLSEAQALCQKSGIKFNTWCADHVVEQSARTIRQLVAIGGSAEPAKALADLRSDNKEANKKLRARKKASTSTSTGEASTSTSAGKVSTLDRLSDTLGQLQDDEARNTLAALAERQGARLVTPEEAKRLKAQPVTACFKDIMGLFEMAPGSVQMEIVIEACKRTGTEITNEFADASPAVAEDLTAIPEFLARTPEKKSRRKAA
jgi:hypothetical protein